MSKVRFIVDAGPLVEIKMSGVSHALAGLLGELVELQSFQQEYQVYLVVPRGRKKLLKKFGFVKHCRVKQIPIPMKILNGLVKYKFLPRMDWVLGRGIYFFPNFKNWPLSKKSYSYTTIHDICFAIHPEFVQPKNQQMLIKKVPLFLKQTNTVIAVSHEARKEIIDYYDLAPRSVITIPNSYERKIYRRFSRDEIKRVKKKHKINSKYVLFVGNIEPRKNLVRLIDAYLNMPIRLRKKYALVMVGGDGWLNEEILTKLRDAQQTGEMVIKPEAYVTDNEVARLMAGAEALVHPALHEGFGMPPLEALATETPVLASDIPVLHEVLGGAAYYFDPTDSNDISRAMVEVLTNTVLAGELVKAGCKQREKFQWVKSAETLHDHMNGLTLRF